MLQFDEAMNKALEKEVTTKTTFKGHLDSYRFCDQVRICLNMSAGKHCWVERSCLYHWTCKASCP